MTDPLKALPDEVRSRVGQLLAVPRLKIFRGPDGAIALSRPMPGGGRWSGLQDEVAVLGHSVVDTDLLLLVQEVLSRKAQPLEEIPVAKLEEASSSVRWRRLGGRTQLRSLCLNAVKGGYTDVLGAVLGAEHLFTMGSELVFVGNSSVRIAILYVVGRGYDIRGARIEAYRGSLRINTDDAGPSRYVVALDKNRQPRVLLAPKIS